MCLQVGGQKLMLALLVVLTTAKCECALRTMCKPECKSFGAPPNTLRSCMCLAATATALSHALGILVVILVAILLNWLHHRDV